MRGNQALLDKVIDEYHGYGSASTNENYKLDRKIRLCLVNLLVHVNPTSFKAIQSIYDCVPPHVLPFNQDCLGMVGWLMGSQLKGVPRGKKHGIWSEMKMTAPAQMLFTDRIT